MPDLINGVPLVWDDGEDLFGSLYNNNANLSINSIKKEGPVMIAFPSIKGPFEEDEIYKNEFITLDINLKQLIGDIKKFRENKRTISFDYSNYAPKVNSNKEPSVTIASTTNVSMGDKQIPFSVNNTSLRIRGLLNTKIDVVDFGRRHEFEFQFNPYAETISFGIWFTYKTFNSSEQESRYAIGLETWFYADFKKLLDHLGILVSDTEQKYIISRYNIAFKIAKNDPDKLDFLYEYAPDFVIRSISDEVLFYHLHLLVRNRIDSIGTNENIAVINLINGIKNKKRFYDQINTNPEIIRRLFEKFTPVHIPELVSALCLVGYSVWDERDFKKIISFYEETETKDLYGRLQTKIVGWCIYQKNTNEYEIGYTVHEYDAAPIPNKSSEKTLGKVKPYAPLRILVGGENIYIPAFLAEYLTNLKFDEHLRNFLDLTLVVLLPEALAFKTKSLVSLGKLTKTSPTKLADELAVFAKIDESIAKLGINMAIPKNLLSKEASAARLTKITDTLKKGDKVFDPAKKALKTLGIKLPKSKNGLSVDFAETPYLYPAKGNEKPIIKIKLTGSDYYDKKLAEELSGIPLKDIEGKYTWHHLDDYDPVTNSCTMQLVEIDIHRSCNPHIGSVEVVRRFFPNSNLYPNRNKIIIQ